MQRLKQRMPGTPQGMLRMQRWRMHRRLQLQLLREG